jgi:hypothetical protein
MQTTFEEGMNSPSAAELELQELLAITAFCQAQKPRIEALHDNIVRVYGKAGESLENLQTSLLFDFYVRSARAVELDASEDCIRL